MTDKDGATVAREVVALLDDRATHLRETSRWFHRKHEHGQDGAFAWHRDCDGRATELEILRDELREQYGLTDQPIPSTAAVSRCCVGVTCHLCGQAPAAHKVEEAIFDDDPNLYRHPLTAYACRECFAGIMYPRRGAAA